MQKVENIHETPHDGKPLLYAGAVEKAQISIYNEDCLQALKAMADKQFDLAIVDPPYGIGASADSRVGGSYTVNLGGVKKKVAAKHTRLKIGIFQSQLLNIGTN